jgi:hypothetical protein
MRNGYPESRGYVYRGAGVDIMPWAITDDCGTDYDTGVAELRFSRPARSKRRCERCQRIHQPRRPA